MKVVRVNGVVTTVELTRRNLTALLAKLDGHPPDSKRTLDKEGVRIIAVEDEEHYGPGREPGEVHADTLQAMRGKAALKHAEKRQWWIEGEDY